MILRATACRNNPLYLLWNACRTFSFTTPFSLYVRLALFLWGKYQREAVQVVMVVTCFEKGDTFKEGFFFPSNSVKLYRADWLLKCQYFDTAPRVKQDYCILWSLFFYVYKIFFNIQIQHGDSVIATHFKKRLVFARSQCAAISLCRGLVKTAFIRGGLSSSLFKKLIKQIEMISKNKCDTRVPCFAHLPNSPLCLSN